MAARVAANDHHPFELKDCEAYERDREKWPQTWRRERFSGLKNGLLDELLDELPLAPAAYEQDHFNRPGA